MRGGSRLAMGLGFLVVAVTAAAAFGSHGADEQSALGAPAQQQDDGTQRLRQRAPGERCGGRTGRDHGRGRRGGRGAGRRLVHGEMKVEAREGFATAVVDAGEIVTLDDDASRVEIRRADGETVTATAGDDTRVCRDGRAVEFAALEVGDLAKIVEVTRDGETVVRGIRAGRPVMGRT